MRNRAMLIHLPNMLIGIRPLTMLRATPLFVMTEREVQTKGERDKYGYEGINTETEGTRGKGGGVLSPFLSNALSVSPRVGPNVLYLSECFPLSFSMLL